MNTSIQRLLKMKTYKFWINAHSPTEKQSNEDWNTLIHLKSNGPSIKVPLVFRFLSSLSTYVFMINFGLNGYVYILDIVLDILDKLIHDSRNVCGCLTLNEMHIELVSLIIWLINDKLNNTPLTFPSEVKTVLYIVSLVILYTSIETSIYCKFKDKS